MGFRYRRSVKIIPGIRLNFSKSGVSTTIGRRGSTMTFGKNGTYLNVGIPGSGMSWRSKIGGTTRRRTSIPDDMPIPEHLLTPELDALLELKDKIVSVQPDEVTSQDFQGIKQVIIDANAQRVTLRGDITDISKSIKWTKFWFVLLCIMLIGFLFWNYFKNLIQERRNTILELQTHLDNSYVNMEIEFDDEQKMNYNAMVRAFKNMATSQKIWDITSEEEVNQYATRSAASTSVRRKETKFELGAWIDIKSDYQALILRNRNGADIYIYPNFIIAVKDITSFGVIGFSEMELQFKQVSFHEKDSVPSDSLTIGETWLKVNKNGTPDRRFSGNYKIPIAQYGELKLKTSTGLNESYIISNFSYCQDFYGIFEIYSKSITKLKELPPAAAKVEA